MEKNSFFLEFQAISSGDKIILDLRLPEWIKGAIYRLAAILYSEDFSIVSVSVEHLPAKWHYTVVCKSVGSRDWDSSFAEEIKFVLSEIFQEKMSLTSFLSKKGKALPNPLLDSKGSLTFENISKETTKMKIKTLDRPGFLFQVAQILFLDCIDIVSLSASTKGDLIDDEFLIRTELGTSLDESGQERLEKKLKKLF